MGNANNKKLKLPDARLVLLLLFQSRILVTIYKCDLIIEFRFSAAK